MRWIIASSLRFRILIVLAAAATLAAGIVQLPRMPADVLPDFTPPHVQIQTEALGLSSAEVEQMVTVPLEQDLLNGVPWLDQIRSESVPGLSSIDLIFERGTDVLRARQVVQERITQARALPNVSQPPVMIQPTSSSSRVMMVGLSSDKLSLIEMSVLARWRVRPRLMGVPGVANVAIWGQRERQLQVQVDPARLRANGVSLTQVISTTGNALWESPLSFLEASSPGTGGFIDTANQRLGVQHVSPIKTAGDLAQVTVEDTEGRTLRLADVSEVVEDHQPLIGDAAINGGPGLILVIERLPGTSPAQVTRDIDAALDDMRPGLPSIVVDGTLYRSTSFIDTAIGNVGLALLIGLLLLALVLGALLLSWRTALTALVATVLSIVVAVFVLYLRGAPMNAMVLAGLVAALGVVIDDAVTGVADIRRRLGERAPAAPAASVGDAIREAILATRGPLLYATLVLLLAAAPFVFLTGLAGTLARPVVLSYGAAVLASLLVALTVTPALALVLLRRTRSTAWVPTHRASPVARWVAGGHAAALTRLIRRPGPAFAGVAVLALAGLALLPALATPSMIPTLRDRNLLIRWEGAPGTSQPEMVRITDRASDELRAIPGVRRVGAHIGRAVTSDQVVGINAGEIWVSLAGNADYGPTVGAIQRVLDNYPGVTHALQTYTEQRTRQELTGAVDPLVVRIYGEDLGTLRAKADEVRHLLAGVRGVSAAHVAEQAEEPTVEIEVNLAAAQRHGVKPGDVRRAAATVLSGIQVGSLFEQQKVFDVVVRGAPAVRHDLGSVNDLLIDTPDHRQVRLAEVATVRIRPAPSAIRHDAVSRSIDVGAAVGGRSLSSVQDEVRARLRGVSFPLEYHAELVGDSAQRTDGRRLLILGLAAAIGALLLLQSAFGGWRLAGAFLLTLPTALAGGALAALLAGGPPSLATLFGLLGALAVAARTGVLLIRHCQRLAEDGEPHGPGLVLRAVRERIAPILITALATGAAVLPLILLGGSPGLEVLRPVAVALLGGLVTATVFTLFVVPLLYLGLGATDRPTQPSTREPEVSEAGT